MKPTPHTYLRKFIKQLGILFLFPFLLLSHNNWAPIMMDGITMFVPFSNVDISLGANRVIKGDTNSVIVADVTHAEEVERFEWREGNKVLGTGISFSTAELSLGTHTLTLVAILYNGIIEEQSVTITIQEDAPDELESDYSGGFVGTTKGEFAVSQGTASYSLKIDVPPGVAGMEPKLSLHYSSTGGNGYMGVGWSMGGVSTISRCPQTKATDGSNHKFGVHYDSNDRFCMDGQRLIVVSGSYGADGSEYRTEISNYSKIVLHGDANNGTGKFEVKTKSGLIYHYGYTADSTQKAGGSYYGANTFWKVSRIEDTYGNTIDFHYTSNTSKGEHYLSSVSYADNRVSYIYESTRSDKIHGYQAGYPYAVEKRLKRVVVKTGNTEVRHYEIAYQRERSGHSRSLLKRITEVLPHATLKPLNFTWHSNGVNDGFSYTLNQSSSLVKNGSDNYGYNDEDNYPYIFTPELNGDGLSDICYRADTGIKCYINHNGSFNSSPDISTSICKKNDNNHGVCNDEDNWDTIRFADMNGDGLSDLVFRSDAGMRIYKSTGTNLVYLSGNTILSNDGDYYGNNNENNWKYIYTTDYDGDGALDICYRSDKGINCHKNFGNGGFTSYPTVHTTICANDSQANGICRYESNFQTIRFVDMDADGRSDILYRSNHGLRLWKSTGSGFTLTTQSTIAKNPAPYENVNLNFTFKHNIQTPDMNGDGLPDVCYRDTTGIKCYTNTGGTFSNTPSVSTTICADGSTANGVCNDRDNYRTIQYIDTDADGLPDLTYRSDAGLRIWKNTGHGFAYSPQTSTIMQNYVDSFGNNDYDNWGTRAYFDMNGDGLQDFYYRSDAGINIYKNISKSPRITEISNSADQSIEINYKYMRDSSVYYNYSTHGSRNAYAWNDIDNDNIEMTLPKALVSSVESDNGIGGKNTLRYKYYGYILNKLRGMQGFHAITTYDDTAQMYATEYYKQISDTNADGFQYTGMPYAVIAGREYGGPSNEWLSYTSIVYNDAKTSSSRVYEPYTYSNIESIYDPESKDLIKKVLHFNTLSNDGLGNVKVTIDKIEDKDNNTESSKTTVNTYGAEDTNAWHIGRLTASSVSHSSTGDSTITRKSTFTYNDKGVLKKEIANAQSSALALTKTYTYTPHGNKKTETISGAGLTTATTTYGYDSVGKFQTSVTDAGGYTITKAYDARFGTIKRLTDANGLVTTWLYDEMGRKIKENRPDGTSTQWRHEWAANNNSYIYAPHALYSVATLSSGAPFSRIYYDSLGREVGSYSYSMRTSSRPSPYDRRVYSLKTYNSKGELINEQLPHYRNKPVGKIVTEYDKYGRVIKVTKTGPTNQSQVYTTSYTDFSIHVTDPSDVMKLTVKNAFGQTVSVTDGQNTTMPSSIYYFYDAAGNLLQTIDAKGNLIAMEYDSAGNKVKMTDPDLGEWHYSYNALGKLKKQWSGANGYTQSKHASYNNYDVLGRITREMSYNRQEYNSNSSTYSYNQTDYTYYSASAAKGSRGQVMKTISSSRTKGGASSTQYNIHYYDSLGRETQGSSSVSSSSLSSKILISKKSYDRYSRLSTITYPNGYRITHHYQNGILDQIIGSDGKVHYKVTGLNAFGEIADASFANGVRTAIGYDTAGYVGSIRSGQGSYYTGNVQQVYYTYDSMGNVKTRRDSSIPNKYINETFTYDVHNRLSTLRTSSNVAGSYFKNKAYRYDKIGNITYKTGMGDYHYNGLQPHAVTSTTSNSYLYDAVGNMTYRNGDSITYNPLNKPSSMKHSGANESQRVYFDYGVGGARFLKRTAQADTYYLGKAYEEKVEGNEITQTAYLMLGAKTIGSHVVKLDTDYVPTNTHYKETYNRYFHADALGSITAITDDSGTVVERRSYTPFGKVRAMNYYGNVISDVLHQTNRAYTGHEQITELSGLIHMNARVYDADLGRFLSADTVIQDPHDSQAYNRYSYVRNNPLKYTDPTGHSWWTKFRDKWVKPVVTAVVGVVIAIYAPQLLSTYLNIATGTLASAVATGALAGAAGGAIMTGTLRGTLKGAAFGAVGAGMAFGIGNAGESIASSWGAGAAKAGRALLHGLSRAAITRAQGGKFSAGFWSGFASSALAPLARSANTTTGKVAMSAIVGGTASAVGGGKFANGAVSGAFVMMFNDMMHSTYPSREKMKSLSMSGWKYGKNGRYKTWVVDGVDTGNRQYAGFEYYNGKSPREQFANGIGKVSVDGIHFVGQHPDSFGLGLSIASALGTGGLANVAGYAAIGIDVYQNDPTGVGVGVAALTDNPKAIAIDLLYGLGQLF